MKRNSVLLAMAIVMATATIGNCFCGPEINAKYKGEIREVSRSNVPEII